ncbi:MAG: 4-(cytidine 5'-diphospho)-2-C-methyl-D-erythritol kinase [bacterium]|nr:4-(cytidine 5'-diphospho)-2-C-methyl-D-erythritol kinase [bacterium]
MNSISLLSYAKVNLYLDILDKRPDNYHNILSLFQEIDLADKIVLEEIPEGITLHSEGIKVPEGNNNLVVKAARLFQETFQIKKGVSINLIKKIPVSAGLGGGSSNAASVLKGLNLLWQAKIPNEKILSLAFKSGSDVPFFLIGGTCIGKGRGEILIPVHNSPPFWLVIIKPEISVSTQWAYQKLELTNTKNMDRINCPFFTDTNYDFITLKNNLYNKFESCVIREFPKIGEKKKELECFGLNALMSGSGSAVFGITQEKEKAESVYNNLKAKGEQVFLAKTRHH